MLKAIFSKLGTALGFGGGGDSLLLTKDQFTQELVAKFREKAPEVKVEVVATCHLKLTDQAGRSSTAYLDNAYTQYQQNPGGKNRVFNDYIRSFRETLGTMDKAIDPKCIIPVIKSKEYLKIVAEQMKREASTAGKTVDMVHESLNDELDILYVEDTPQNMRYLTKENLEKLGIAASELRALAVKNLPDCLPPVRLSEHEGIYIADAGGDYETSLLLLESFWQRDDLQVKGEMIVGLPARGALLVTGTGDALAVQLLKGLAVKMAGEAAYPLTEKLFVRRNGGFELW